MTQIHSNYLRRLPAPVTVFIVALFARITPLFLQGGFGALGRYDDAVYFSASSALVSGRTPYVDFVFLHPPGILLALAPFTYAAEWIGESNAFHIAQLTWAILGACTAVACCLVGRSRFSQRAGLVAGVAYALFPPAVYADSSISLETLVSACVALTLLLTKDSQQRASTYAACGAVAAFGASIKIWGVVAVAALAIWSLRQGRRQVYAFATGTALGFALPVLPFLSIAGNSMWRMVIEDQLGRPRQQYQPAARLLEIMGLSIDRNLLPAPIVWGVAAAIAAILAVVVGRGLQARQYLIAGLLTASIMTLFASPSFFAHYGAFIAVPLACSIGGVAVRRRDLIVLGSLFGIPASIGLAMFLARGPGTHPPSEVIRAVQTSFGCVASDDPGVLISADALRSDLQRGCIVWPDVTGMTYDRLGGRPSPGEAWKPRSERPPWQRQLRGYMLPADVVVLSRPSTGVSADTLAELSATHDLRSLEGFRMFTRRS